LKPLEKQSTQEEKQLVEEVSFNYYAGWKIQQAVWDKPDYWDKSEGI